jgi:catechol 2,3-dioxygenase-like lactoylglutathione lyase family enzyme
MVEYVPSHTGLCITDLDRSLRFYCEGLGFELGKRYELTRPIAESNGPVLLSSQFIQRASLNIELLYFRSPPPEGVPSSRRNQLGLTHLSFIVDDIDAATTRLEAAGGKVVAGTRVDHSDGLQVVFIADPDGVRIELLANVPD